jgi:hypothetical protein
MKRITDIKEANRKLRQLDRSLRELTLATGSFLRSLDVVMREPSTAERGAKIAKLAGALEYNRDLVRYNTLGIDFRHDPEIRNGKRIMPKLPIGAVQSTIAWEKFIEREG